MSELSPPPVTAGILAGEEPPARPGELKRGLNVLGNLALTLSDITPTASLLVVGTAVIATAGTGSVIAYIVGCFIAVNVALCMGELGSMYPVAGGLYSIVTRVLGKPVGFLALLMYMGQAIFLPASASTTITASSSARKTAIISAFTRTSSIATSATRIIIPAAIQFVETPGASEWM